MKKNNVKFISEISDAWILNIIGEYTPKYAVTEAFSTMPAEFARRWATVFSNEGTINRSRAADEMKAANMIDTDEDWAIEEAYDCLFDIVEEITNGAASGYVSEHCTEAEYFADHTVVKNPLLREALLEEDDEV